ncbi:hypothetical protein ADUPG1_006953 [Aduncisulcus paluster]|uniref:Gamma tubulin complex component C-terminal domain-containing protein n=1 Tax=Aduncisulcus paluster TaxID=2918883 RepID=A0ABQ5KN14_9EUKA|nr:hypothetical protein ADUPG1_006953 [Aduncisulcus paluster]
MFRFMWTIRKAEKRLTTVWVLNTSARRALYFLPKRVKAEVSDIFRAIGCIRARLSHIIIGIQYYIHMDVLEAGWMTMLEKMKKSTCIQDLIYCHRDFVRKIYNSIHLRVAQREESKRPSREAMPIIPRPSPEGEQEKEKKESVSSASTNNGAVDSNAYLAFHVIQICEYAQALYEQTGPIFDTVEKVFERERSGLAYERKTTLVEEDEAREKNILDLIRPLKRSLITLQNHLSIEEEALRTTIHQLELNIMI